MARAGIRVVISAPWAEIVAVAEPSLQFETVRWRRGRRTGGIETVHKEKSDGKGKVPHRA